MTDIFPYDFGRYRLLQRIALGGMAELFRGAIRGMEGFEKKVAIKRILPHLTDQHELVQAFIGEAKLAALLQHPNIVQIYDFGSIQGGYFIAMELLSGKDLSHLSIRAKEKHFPITLEHALFITARICEGLDYAHDLKDIQGHSVGIIHRDISPPNILVTYDGEVKILDFGVAKAAGMNTKTREGVIKGKVCYMSPEQASGLDIDHRSDLFSAGVLLYEMLSGQRMFTGDPLHTLLRVREADFQSPEEVAPHLPQPIHQVLHRALAKDPESRYPSASEMLADIEEFLHKNSLRPSARTLARYVRDLFADDMVSEAAALCAGSEASRSEPKTLVLGQEKASIKTALMTVATVPKTQNPPSLRWMLFSVLPLALFIAGFLALSFSQESFSALYHHLSELPGAPAASMAGASSPAMPSSSSQLIETLEAGAQGSESNMPQLEPALNALKEERFEMAAGIFQELLMSRPEWIGEIRRPYASALAQWAMSVKNEEPEKAVKLLEQALGMDSNLLQARFELACLYTALGQNKKAIQAYEDILADDPTMAEALFNLAYLRAMKNDYPRAELLYHRLVALSPPYLDEVLFNLAVVQEKQGKKASSLDSLKKALAFNPHNNAARTFLHRTSGGSS
jgi:serine/threonine protein kinase